VDPTTGARGVTTGASAVGAWTVAIVGLLSSRVTAEGLTTGETSVVAGVGSTVGILDSLIASSFAPNNLFKPHNPNKPRGSSSHHGNPPASEGFARGATAGLTGRGAGAAFGTAAMGLAVVEAIAVPFDCAIAPAIASFISTTSAPPDDTDWIAAFASSPDK